MTLNGRNALLRKKIVLQSPPEKSIKNWQNVGQ